jgi:hypothetical protein
MIRSTAVVITLLVTALTSLTLLPVAAFASGTSRVECDSTGARGDCPPAAYSGGLTASCKNLPCRKDDVQGLSTAEMIYLHEKITGDAVAASAAATWSSALAQTQSAMADTTAAKRSPRRGTAGKTSPNSRRNVRPGRKPSES